MASYQFRYANHTGGVVRAATMQCDGDEAAIRKARDSMQDAYATLEIFADDRPVFSGPSIK